MYKSVFMGFSEINLLTPSIHKHNTTRQEVCVNKWVLIGFRFHGQV
nr:MAG TPA: hypothetical protein [Caudoviricetes sp.]